MNSELKEVSRIGAAPRPEYAYVPLSQQRAAVVRELGMRNRVYPKWIDSGRMKPAEAAHQLAAMQCVLDTIDGVGEAIEEFKTVEYELRAALREPRITAHADLLSCIKTAYAVAKRAREKMERKP